MRDDAPGDGGAFWLANRLVEGLAPFGKGYRVSVA